MTKEQLKQWLANKKFGAVILVCPRCGKVDISPERHLDECDPGHEARRMEAQDNEWK